MSHKIKVRYVDISKKQQLRFRKLSNKEQLAASKKAILAFNPTHIAVVPYSHVRKTANVIK